jgi:hypothetical protein
MTTTIENERTITRRRVKVLFADVNRSRLIAPEHGLVDDDVFYLQGTGMPPAPLVNGQPYYAAVDSRLRNGAHEIGVRSYKGALMLLELSTAGTGEMALDVPTDERNRRPGLTERLSAVVRRVVRRVWRS